MHRSSARAWLGMLALVALLGPWCPTAVAQKKEEAPLAVPIRGISGMAALDENEYLVVHDLKKDAGDRLGVLHVRKKKAPSYQPIAVNWPKSGDATDLEALCAVPGRTNEYLACESGAGKPKEGRLFHLALHKDDGEWQAKIRKTIALPEDADNIEGIACLEAKGGDLIVILGERGQGPDNPGKLRWGVVDLAKGTLSIRHELRLKPAPGQWPVPASVRGCADMLVDAEHKLWIVAAMDVDDPGPFRSVIYCAGMIRVADRSIEIELGDAEPTWTCDGIKVEALATGPPWDGIAFSIASDDEIYGGIWRPLAKR